jgi:uncharacterized paraquat-inducible protein A
MPISLRHRDRRAEFPNLMRDSDTRNGSQLSQPRLIACPDCGAVQVVSDIRSGRLQCWRCEATLEQATGRSLDAPLACSLTTLMFLLPASFCP